MLSKRAEIEQSLRTEADKNIFENVIKLDVFKKADKIFTYINTSAEAGTKELIKYAFKNGKKVHVPVTLRERIYFSEISTFDGLKETKMGILEPESDIEQMPLKGDVFIVPGSVFDKHGHRYGYGAGYYDKFFSGCISVIKIALCYDFQLLENIETKEHDIDMDIIVTDKRIVFCGKGEIL